jgi:hypothetical protein
MTSENFPNDNVTKLIMEYRTHSEKTLEKQIVYISSGALGVTFIFSEKFITLTSCQYKPILILSWISFAVTLLFNLLSQYTSVLAADKFLESVNFSSKIKSIKFWNRFTKSLQILSILTLLTGIILFVIFISINL